MNNRMEMMAAIVGLEALTKSCHVTLYSDSNILLRLLMTIGLMVGLKRGGREGIRSLLRILTSGSDFLKQWNLIRLNMYG